MECRAGCGACCIAPSISSPIPGMASGKPAGMRCIQLDETNRCRLFGQPERPLVCLRFDADPAVCGHSTEQAMQLIGSLELATTGS